MDQETKQLLEDLGKSVSELRASSEEAEQKGVTERAEHKQLVDRINDRVDELEVRLQKSSLDTRRDGERSEERKAMEQWLRKGAVGPDEEKVLRISDDTGGGFLAESEFVGEIIKGVLEFSPMRELARVRKTTKNSIKAPKRTGVASATWVSEQGTRSETTNPTYGQEEIPNHELYALADISHADLEDPEFDLEEELRLEFSEQFGVAEGVAFVAGNGVGKPEGFLEHGDVGGITSTSNDALHGDDFVKLLYELKEPYHANASWLLNRLAVRDARLLKDSQNQYIWQAGLAGNVPNTILDRPYRMAKDMPVVANAAKAVAVGDWRKAYWIADRIQMALQRDPYTQATSGNVRFIARKRVGGQVVVPEAIKILTIQ